MTDKEIFENAQVKAAKNGFTYFPVGFEFNVDFAYGDSISTEYFLKNNPIYNTIIFSHEFAKAFWGVKYPDDFNFGDFPEHFHNEYWKTELTWMVLKEEPLKYLEKFLKD